VAFLSPASCNRYNSFSTNENASGLIYRVNYAAFIARRFILYFEFAGEKQRMFI